MDPAERPHFRSILMNAALVYVGFPICVV
jgi:hypothetical protein